MIRILRDILLIALVTLVLFAALNVAAWYYLKSSSSSSDGWQNRWFVAPGSQRGLEIRRAALGIDDDALLRSLDISPPLRAHTVLQFTNSISGPPYTIGVENIRYMSGWTDASVREALSSNEAVFVFGGSTTFGHGVTDDDHLVGYLNSLDPDNTYINFGINAYDSLREVDKLLYLLRKGYRPARVIFVDGLNDATTFTSTPQLSHDKPRTQGYLIDRGSPALIFGSAVPNNMLLAFAYALPITHLYFEIAKPLGPVPYGSVNPNVHSVNYRSAAWHYENQFEYGDEYRPEIIADWLAYYPRNIEFVRGVAEAFDFDVEFVFQPFGITDKENPFLRPSYFNRGVQT